MPDIVGPHNSSQVFVDVILLPVERFEDALDPQRLSKAPNLQVLRALIDTGAQVTSITQNAVQKLKLEPSGMVGIQGFAGPSYHPFYIFKIGFMELQENELGYRNPKFHILDKEIEGPEFDCGIDADFDVLLGMDVLSIGTLTISPTGSFKFSF
ncbi:MAG TPA: retroviral-like aspartic protease family protein [Allosphingosinicella sp.]|jgi:hypothetical protein